MERDSLGRRRVFSETSAAGLLESVKSCQRLMPQLWRIFLAGGEPTLNPEFLDLVSGLRALGLRPDVVTAGGRFQQIQWARDFKAAGGAKAHLSLHSHEKENHDFLAGRNGAYETALRSLDNLQNARIPFNINFVLTSRNVGDLDKSIEFFEARVPGADRIVLYLVRPVGRAGIDLLPDLRLAGKQVRRAIETSPRVLYRDLPPCFVGSHDERYRFQDFLFQKQGRFTGLQGERYRRKWACLFCGSRAVCPGILASYPRGTAD